MFVLRGERPGGADRPIIRVMARRALPPPTATGPRSRQRPSRHQSVSAAWACARSSFRALKCKFPARAMSHLHWHGRICVRTSAIERRQVGLERPPRARRSHSFSRSALTASHPDETLSPGQHFIRLSLGGFPDRVNSGPCCVCHSDRHQLHCAPPPSTPGNTRRPSEAHPNVPTPIPGIYAPPFVSESNCMPVRFPFDNSYVHLPQRLFARLDPTPVAAPRLVHLNADLAANLGLDPKELASAEGVEVWPRTASPKVRHQSRSPMLGTSCATSSLNGSRRWASDPAPARYM